MIKSKKYVIKEQKIVFKLKLLQPMLYIISIHKEVDTIQKKKMLNQKT
jgi:hypothetical protein